MRAAGAARRASRAARAPSANPLPLTPITRPPTLFPPRLSPACGHCFDKASLLALFKAGVASISCPQKGCKKQCVKKELEEDEDVQAKLELYKNTLQLQEEEEEEEQGGGGGGAGGKKKGGGGGGKRKRAEDD